MIRTETQAHQVARDLAMRQGRDFYVVTRAGRFEAVPKPPKDAEPLGGYHPSGNPIREGETA